MKQAGINPFAEHLLNWYQQNKRLLPWRETKDPYFIWLSEIILQQTRVAQGLPYYNRFVKQYPSVIDLATASEEEVLRLWQGLGYYSRARNLHKCAKTITKNHNAIFPDSMKQLLLLPGIGNYTAAAIASLAFDKPVPVVDGNVYRVLARYFGIDIDIASSAAFKQFNQLSTSLIDTKKPGDYNQAVMEFGALHCTPQKPACNTCILNKGCIAYAKNLQEKLPIKRKKKKSRERYFNYLLIRYGNKMLMRQRLESDIWQGLYEFVLIETPKPIKDGFLRHPALSVLENFAIEFVIDDKIIRHVLSHQVLNVNFAVVNIDENSDVVPALATDRYDWYDLEEVEELPKPVLIANFLNTYLNSINLQ